MTSTASMPTDVVLSYSSSTGDQREKISKKKLKRRLRALKSEALGKVKIESCLGSVLTTLKECKYR